MRSLSSLALALAMMTPFAIAKVSKMFDMLPVLVRTPQFDIDFGGFIDSAEATEQVFMRLGDSSFECRIPKEPRIDNHIGNFNNDDLLAAGSEVIGATKECIIKLDVYWGYQLCPGHQVLQFEPEWVSQTELRIPEDGASYMLGRSEIPDLVLGEKNDIAYLKATYTNGDMCDLTGQPRVTEVFYYCDPDINVVKLDSVREVTICEYQAYVAHPDLCQIEGFQPKLGYVNRIDCVEIVDEKAVPVDEYHEKFPLLQHFAVQVQDE